MSTEIIAQLGWSIYFYILMVYRKQISISLLFIVASYVTIFAQVSKNDSLALIKLFETTSGENWIRNEGWLSKTVSEWEGVTVTRNESDEFNITAINLHNNNLLGTIPEGIFSELTHLKSIYIGSNKIILPVDFLSTGTIEAISIRNLGLDDQTIPSGIWDLNLTYLDLAFNNLTVLPPERIFRKELRVLSLESNEFSGILPDYFWIPKYGYLSLALNSFEGPFQIDQNYHTELYYLDIQRNNFTSINDLTLLDLSTFEIWGNQLEFPDLVKNKDNAEYWGRDVVIKRMEILNPNIGERVRLNMRVKHHSENRYKWYSDKSDKVLGTSQYLTISSFQENDKGLYYLVVENNEAGSVDLIYKDLAVGVPFPASEAPENIYGNQSGNRQVLINWDDIYDVRETGFEIQRAEKTGNFTNTPFETIAIVDSVHTPVAIMNAYEIEYDYLFEYYGLRSQYYLDFDLFPNRGQFIDNSVEPGKTYLYKVASLVDDRRSYFSNTIGVDVSENRLQFELDTNLFYQDEFLSTTMSALWRDVDEDNDPDLLLINYSRRSEKTGLSNKNRFYENNGDGTFKEVEKGDLTLSPISSRRGRWSDLNNDGLPDFVQTVWTGNEYSILLYRNQNNTYVSDTIRENLSTDWIKVYDQDGDGYLDLIAQDFYFNKDGNDFERLIGGGRIPSATHILSFFPIDMNKNGKMDLYLNTSQDNGLSEIYENIGNNAFSKRLNTVEGLSEPAFTWADFDLDNRLDFAEGRTSINQIVVYSNRSGPNHLDIEKERIQKFSTMPGMTSGDLDNDGDVDIVFIREGVPTILWNYGNGFFTFKIMNGYENSFDRESKWSSISLADYNLDGFLDIIFTGARSGDRNRLYRNTGNNNNWLKVKLIGKFSNRDGIGAYVTVYTNGRPNLRYLMPDNGRGTGNELISHFGLGDEVDVDSIVVKWPSGILQTVRDVEVNQSIVIEEEFQPLYPNLTLLKEDQLLMQIDTVHFMSTNLIPDSLLFSIQNNSNQPISGLYQTTEPNEYLNTLQFPDTLRSDKIFFEIIFEPSDSSNISGNFKIFDQYNHLVYWTHLVGESQIMSLVTGLKEKEKSDVHIFPNPITSGNINLSFNSKSNTFKKIRLVDIRSGTTLKKVEGTKNNFQFQVENLPSGIYVLEVFEGDKQSSYRLIVL